MSFLYLGGLLLSLACLVMIDRRFGLVFWRRPRRAALVLVIGLLFFTAWDLFGIGLGIFARGETAVLTGLTLAYEFPLEELFFLTFLCYLTMLLVSGADRLLGGRRAAR